MKTKKTVEEMDFDLGFVFIIYIIVSFILFIVYAPVKSEWSFAHLKCKSQDISNGKDLYCQLHDGKWIMSSHNADQLANAQWEESERIRIAKKDEMQREADRCYKAGNDTEILFDLFDDYNLSCKKVDYYIQNQVQQIESKESGYIEGSFTGIANYGDFEGKSYQWIVTEITANEQLAKNVTYHTDCNNSITDKKVNYYDNNDLINEYIKRCLK